MFKKSYYFSNIIIFYLFFLLSGCQHLRKPPLGRDLNTSDFQTLTTPILDTDINKETRSNSNEIVHNFVLPEVYKKKICFFVSSSIPLYAVLQKAAQMLSIDTQISQAVQNKKAKINFSATDKKFIDILEGICSAAKLRYRISNGILFIENDKPFSRVYNVQFLNLTRTSSNNISSATDIFSNSISGGNNSAASSEKIIGISKTCSENGSSTFLNMNSENDFWKELDINLKTLLLTSNSKSKKNQAHYTIHKQAGLISVFGTSEQHNFVKDYLELLHSSISSQILIEAKFIEVTLKDEFKGGIDWNWMSNFEDKANKEIKWGKNFIGGALGESASTIADIPAGVFSFTTNFTNGLSGFIKALDYFGTTRTLSSPRITVMNNQNAMLKIAENHVYFKLNYNKHFYAQNEQSDFSVGSDIKTIPIGLVMSVQAAIDPIKRNVILFLRPTISKLSKTVSDPSVVIAHAQSGDKDSKNFPVSEVPVVEVKEIDSVLRLKDGEVAILGGLMESKSKKDTYQNPLFKNFPKLKDITSSSKTEDKVTEIVILIKVKILDTVKPDMADTRLAHLYTNDPRPFR